VHLDDIDGLLRLCRALLRPGLPWHAPWRDDKRLLGRRFAAYRSLLR